MQSALKKPTTLPPSTPGNVSNWNASSSWGSGGSGGGETNDDDGGWSQGPPASGSGWTSGAASNGSSTHDLLDWQNSNIDAGSDWQMPPSQSIIVDRNDKEAWPSIGGDHSETTSENDNVSVKSESVISVSSFGQESTSNNAGSSAIQVPTSSSLWSSGSTYPVSESSTWDYGISTPSTATSTGGWSSTSTSLSKASQGLNMQGAIGSPGNGESPTITTSSGWGAGSPGTLPQGQNSNQGGNKPQSAVQIPQSLASSIGNGTSAQAITQQRLITSQSSVGSQGNSAYQSNSKSPVDNWGTVGSGVSGTDAGKGNGGNNGQTQSMASGWGTSAIDSNKSAADKWQVRNPSTGDDWANTAAPESQWGTQITPSRASGPPQWPDANNALPAGGQNQNPARSHPTWAQAAGKGLNTNPSNASSSNTAVGNPEVNEAIVSAIESHDGWGKKPVNQVTSWTLETSPKTRRKGSTATNNALPEKPSNPVPPVPKPQGGGNGNMWNNNNGTAIWESNKEPPPAGQWNNGTDPNQWGGVPMKPITKDPSNSWAGGGQAKEPQESSQWGSKTETGSWGNNGEAGGISTWGEGQSRGSGEVDDGTAVWGNPAPTAQKPPNWNSTPVPPTNQNPVPTNVGGVPKNWGESQDTNWQANMTQLPPNRPGGWGGGDSNQWNAAVGGPKPKPPSTSSWGDEWNPTDRKDDMIWNEDGSNWDDTDMGTWNDTAQENNSSWSSAAGWKKDKNKNIKQGLYTKMPSGFHPQTQMRSRMLQQLMEMGFGKTEAQNALINNNMSMQGAMEDLHKMKGPNFKPNELDVFQYESVKPKIPGMDIGATDDISDTHSESNPYVPINSMQQNTPFPNAQSQLPNQFNNMKGPSLPQSSHSNMNNSSIIPPQQRLIQEKFKHQNSMSAPPPGPPPPGQVIGGRGPIPVHQQQMAQQQILQQLHLAVKAGLISPQLLHHQLPPPMLVLLQQLLQNTQLLQSLITTQQVIQQNKGGNPIVQRQQLEQLLGKISSVKHQILLLQRQITEAQKALIKVQQQPPPPDGEQANTSNVTSDLQNLSVNSSQPQPTQSKLIQWKKGSDSSNAPTSSADTGANDSSALNKAVGSKPAIHQSSSRNNLYDLGLSNLIGDQTWTASTTTSSSWPSSTANSISSTNEDKMASSNATDGKESQPAANTSTVTTTLNDSIPEFVPGKPWLGITSKNVEDDPHITPGSFSRSLSLSVNTVKDDYLSSLTKTSPSVTESPSWNSKGNQNPKWSTNDSVPTSFSNEVWGVPLPKNNSRPPPGLLPKSGNWTGVNRQHSWAGTTSSMLSGNSAAWDGISTCLMLKNLTPQIDGSTLRTLCMQHGPLQWFYLSLHNGQALVRYHSKEEAFKAQKSLNTCVLGNTTIVANFVSEAEATRFAEQSAMAAQPSQWSQQHSNPSIYRQASMNSRGTMDLGMYNSNSNAIGQSAPPSSSYASTMWSQGGGLLSGDDHNASALLGNMLGESM
nr:trinucleotide repeat-containing gene 6C protein isoform X1 [Crassostrea gigas]XP_011423532.1 trinucleotide repeat-containing gene 6C protein isoform X1 [Crassostrea gigas]XP_011423533.1 trinucleotide repeat-containing gene 6C protein isoform X1 [Crassostrea gigas]XP_034311210.1 trinucleotide repeat-containing gene 6C protein isoform X1 [Crassostrea gigas]XP_034311211.1 trinucleotide repeat-containing gene 6C protein isoform X1 [Crassostrea gigas]XP_034311212.1 trinucleotide repeat-containin|eukprot:XP_011423531.1 PREDICTED: trinucleotide repeat-containing gene 6C protein isoform X1 [Crassostrea gigas]